MKQANERYAINKKLTKLLLAGKKFTLKMRLKQPGFTYNALGPFTNKRKNTKIYRNRRFTIYLPKQTK